MSADWYKADPRAGLVWAREYMVADLLESAARARSEGESTARFWEGKAALLRDMLDAALSDAAAGPAIAQSSRLEAKKQPLHTPDTKREG